MLTPLTPTLDFARWSKAGPPLEVFNLPFVGSLYPASSTLPPLAGISLTIPLVTPTSQVLSLRGSERMLPCLSCWTLLKGNLFAVLFANWIRLFTRLLPAPYGWQSSSESWRFIQHKLKHFPFWYTLRRVSKPHTLMDLDSSLGFPGEGPSVFCPFRLSISLCRWLTWTLPASLPLSFRAFLDFALSCPSLPINFQPNLHVLVSAELHHVFCWNCLKEDQCLAKPRNRETDCWMVVFKNGWKRWVSLQEILFVPEPDIETLNIQ